jgi:DsbC/DsbD-like thiol-disulfide interchange protein
MGRKHVGRGAGVLALLAVAGLALAQGAQDGPVKVEIKAAKTAAGQEVVNITINVAKNWHIYANPVRNEDLVSAQTIVKVQSKGKIAAEVKYPVGTDHKDSIIGTYKVYEGKVTIPILVQRSDNTPLEVSIRYQPCDATKCLTPVTVKQTVP